MKGMKKISDVICKNSKLILIMSAILLFFSFVGMTLTKVNYDILVYLPQDIETVKGEEILTNDFNMGAYSIAIVNGLNGNDIIKLEDKINNVEGVNNVVSLYDVLGTSVPLDILPSEITSKLHKDDSDVLFITFTDSTSSESTINAVEEIRKITPDNFNLGGMSSVVVDTMELSEKEIMIYIVIAVILCILVLMLSLDSYIVPILLLLNIGCAIMFNLGTNIFLGQISYITKALVAVLQLGVTTDFSIFLYHSYESNKAKFDTKKDAMKYSIMHTFTSVTGSSLTTIAGFLVLCTMSLTLGKDLGIVMAKGVLLGVITVLTLFPSLLLVFDNIIEKTTHKIFIPKFNKLNELVIKYNKVLFIAFLILLLPLYLGYRKVDVYYKMDKTLPETLNSISTNNRLRDEFNLVNTEIIMIDKTISNDKVSSLVKELENIDGVDFVLSFSKIKEMGITEDMIGELSNLISNDKYELILLNSIYDTATDELNNQIGKVNTLVKRYDKNAIVAGEGALMKDLIVTSDSDFKNVNYSSIICIFLILFIVLKSYSLPFLLIIAIEFAIFTNMSISYFNGTTLPFIAPIVLGTIQLGATIDYAILMTSTYLNNRKKYEKKEAMRKTLNYTGTSIFISGMCFFAATFGVGMYSNLDMVGTLCALISRGALISMAVVITVLPSILLIFDKLIHKTMIKKGDNMKNIKKLAIWLMLVTTISIVPVNALTKNETVYQKLNYDGSKISTTVTEQIMNNSSIEEIKDYTTLNNILNLNSNTYIKNNNNLIWNTNKGNVLYSGNIDKELPISVEVLYKLDGKEMKLDDMIGKSGNIEISLKYINNDSHKVLINGKYETLYTPFVITMATIIDSENNKNISISNGKIINNGVNNIVIGIASPGLYESLKLDELKDFNLITINYETTKFELSSIYSVATSKIIDTTDLKIFDKLDSLYSNINKLQDNMNKIEEGSKTLSNGINTLYKNYNEFNNGLSTLNNGMSTLNNGVNELHAGINEVLNNEYIVKVRNYMPTLSQNIENLSMYANNYQEKANSYLDNTNDVVDEIANRIISMIDYLETVEEYKNNNNEYQLLINSYIKTINSYIKLLDNYINDLNNNSTFVKSAATYIINEYNVAKENASDELISLYNQAINLKNNEELSSELIKLKELLTNVNNKLNNDKDKIEKSYNELINKLEGIKESISDLENDKKKVNEIRNNIKTDISKGKNIVNESIKKLNELPKEINDASNKIDELENGLNKLKSGTEELKSGVATLKTYSNSIYKGIGMLNDGAVTLNNGIKTYNKEGIKKISSLVNNEVKVTTNRVKELSKLGNDYNSFAGKSDMDGETKFIMVIDSKKVPKEIKKANNETKKLSLWDRILNLFK